MTPKNLTLNELKAERAAANGKWSYNGWTWDEYNDAVLTVEFQKALYGSEYEATLVNEYGQIVARVK